MKREALDHTKMKRLCRRLNIPLYQAVGILETLWQITAKQSPRGDIGKLSNEDIAIGLDYRDDEDVLIDALVASGWLEEHSEYRLIVHDWDQHCDDALNMRMARSRQFFCTGRAPKTNRLGKWERAECDKFYLSVRTESESVRTASAHQAHDERTPCTPPEPRPAPPEPHQIEELTTCPTEPPMRDSCSPDGERGLDSEFQLASASPPPTNGTLKTHQAEWFEAWWAIYWRKVSRKPAEKAFQKHVRSPDRFAEVMSATRLQAPAMMERDQEHRPHGATWLNAERWTDSVSIPASKPPGKLTVVERTEALWAERIAKGESPL